MANSQPIINIIRGDITESRHRGHAAVVNDQGMLLYSLGDPGHLTFARSAAKLLQAVAVIESGAAGHYQLSPGEIALICASHNGEPSHVEGVRKLLLKLGLSGDNLKCGVHDPFHKETAELMKQKGERPGNLHNNCSGKHAGMLAYSLHIAASIESYTQLEHPVQQQMLQTVSEMCGIRPEDIKIGIDGCGVPVFGMPIDRLALAFARIGKSEAMAPARDEACRLVIAALRKNPYFLAGSGRFDTRLIEVTQGRIIGKMGAEGIFALTIPAEGIGIVVKVEDGSMRAIYPAVVEALKQLKLISHKECGGLQTFHTPTLKNRRGDKVGLINPVFQLQKA